ncbi:MAG: DNA primase [Ignavibacteria bacterium]
MIPQEKIDEILKASDIIEVISEYIDVRKRGESFLAICPFHPDRTPSLSISQKKQVYHCFGCGASGNVFTFLMEYEKISFYEAVKKLADRSGIKILATQLKSGLQDEITKLYEINRESAIFFHNNLMNLGGQEKKYVWDYLKERNIQTKYVKRLGLGYASRDWDSLLNYFEEEKKFSKEDLLLAGLIIEKDDKKGYYDRFRGRLIFPIFNESGKVVGFGGRTLYEVDKQAKYINSPESKIYLKRKILYGLNFAADSIRTQDFVILVEGYMDFLSLFQNGITNVVATSGTSLTKEQVFLLSRYTKNIVVVYDSDVAGIKAAKRSIDLILEQDLNLDIVSLPESEDPDSIIRNEGVDSFLKYLALKKNVIDFIRSLYEKENKLTTVNDKTQFVKDIIEYIAKIPTPIKRVFYIRELAKELKIYESVLYDELNAVIKKEGGNIHNTQLKTVSLSNLKRNQSKRAYNKAEEELIGLMLEADSETFDYLEKELDINFISNKIIQDTVNLLLETYFDYGTVDAAVAITKTDNEEIKSLITRWCNPKYEANKLEEKDEKKNLYLHLSKRNLKKAAHEIIVHLKIAFLENQLDKLIASGEEPYKIFELKKEINSLILSLKKKY